MSDEKPNSPTRKADQQRTDGGEPSSKQMPEGMRVVRKRRKRRGGSRQTLFLKKREILREMHDESGSVGVKEQVERLKTARKAKQENQPLEEHWGGPATKHRGARWALLRAFAIVIPVLAIVTAFLLIKDGESESLPPLDDLDLGKSELEEVLPPYIPTGPIAWINEDPQRAYERPVAILDALNEGDPGTVGEGLFRDEDAALARIAKRGLGWSSEYFTADPRKLFWSIGESGAAGFLLLEGRRSNHERFRSYFVMTPDGLRLDWEASTGWCEVPFERLLLEAPPEPFLVRCVLMKEPHYDVNSGPASLYSWYLLRSPDESQHVWGHVPTGSALDRELLDLFHYGWIVMDRLDWIRATLRLSRSPSGFRPNEFEIEELVTEEWVIPPQGE